MNIILALSSWLALSYLYSSRFRFNIYETWAVSLSTLIIISFFITLIINLEAVIYIKYLLILLGISEFYKNLHSKDDSTKGLILTGALFIFLSYLITRHEAYSYVFNWDDFSHWARSVKLLILDNGYGEKYFSYVLAPSYAPATNTWHAFFQHSSSFEESTLYFTQMIWIISLLLCIYSVLLKYAASFFQKGMSLIVLIGLGNTLTPYGHQLLADVYIGLGAAAIYLIYNYSNHPLLQKIISSSIILFTVVLTKQAGLIVALQFSLINLMTNGFKRKEIFANAVILILSSIGIIVWSQFVIPYNETAYVADHLRNEFFQVFMWQSGVFFDFFVIELFSSNAVEKSHVVIYGSLLYSLAIYINTKSIKLLKIVFIALSFYMLFLIFGYVLRFGADHLESTTLDSINRYVSIQFYFLIPLMLIETLKLNREKTGYFLILLVYLTLSYYFVRLFTIFPIIVIVALVLPKYPLMIASKKIIALLVLLSSASLFFSYDMILRKITPSEEYLERAERIKNIGETLLEEVDARTIVVWDKYDMYYRLAVEYYSDYQYPDFKVISTDEYKSKILTNEYKAPNYKRQLFFNNKKN